MVKKRTKPFPYRPESDGFDHINILAGKAMTVVGKRLSHFAHSPFIHPYYGSFQSMEGFWHYASTGFCHEELRDLIGLRAKQVAQGFRKHWYPEFCEDILAGNYQKIIQDEALANMLVESELPLTHYYLFPKTDEDGPGLKIVVPRESNWLVPGLESIRTALKNGETPECWKASALRYAQNVAAGNPAYTSLAIKSA